MTIRIGDEEFVLEQGEAVKFDASVDHAIRPADDAEFLVALVPKRTR